MAHRAPYQFFETKTSMHTEPRWIWAFGDGVKGAISDVAHFEVPEITFLGWENLKSVVLCRARPVFRNAVFRILRNIPAIFRNIPEYSGKYYGIFRNHVHTIQAIVTGQGRLFQSESQK